MNERQYSEIKNEIATIINSMVSNQNINFNIDNTVVHLTTTIIRLKSKNYIPLSYNQTSTYKNHDFFALANNICNELSTTYSVVFPVNEIAYLTMYLANQTVLDHEFNVEFDLLNQDTIDLMNQTKNLIKDTYPDSKMEATSISALGLHLQQAIIRMKDNKQIENPLSNEIIQKYPLETKYSELCNQIIETKYNDKLTKDELSFITMHFATNK